DDAAQVAHDAGRHMTTLDLHEDALGLAAAVVDEDDLAVDAAVGALLALLAAAVARVDGLGTDERKRPPLELVAAVLGKLGGAGQVFRLADDQVVAAGLQPVGILQPVLLQGDRQVGDVDAYPVAAELLRGGDGRAAAAEGVEHDVTWVAAGRDDAFQ